MSRNAESRFSMNPTNIDIQRSRFKRNSSIKFSFNVGDLIPFFVDEVLPGDTFSVKTSKVVRLQTLITPVMDNLFLDVYWFFVPNRLLWNHWRELMGQNSTSPWTPQVEYSVPQLTAPVQSSAVPTGGWKVGTVADYMGIPLYTPGLSVSALPFRAYGLVFNEWFRDQNLISPLLVPLTDANNVGSNDFSGTYGVRGGGPAKVAKFHDYFTSALPAPQKGPDVLIPVAEGGMLPVVPRDGDNREFFDGSVYHASDPSGDTEGLTSQLAYAGIGFYATGDNNGSQLPGGFSQNATGASPIIDNLYAIQAGDIAAASINQLRLAWQLQRLFEKDARGGTRYIEIIKSHFGVTSPDARQQRPEYLGGNRIPIRVSQVVQQSSTAEGTTPQGNVSGMSLTTDVHGDFRKSFTEHGILLGVCCARYPHTYQQGLERMWSRKTRFDFYWPALANIGEQAVLNKEIYAQGTDADEEVFGYQEAWAEYRYKPSRVAGEMRSTAPTSLDSWHFADDYASQPYLSSDWIQEDKSNVDRVLAVQSSVSNQIFADFYIENDTVRAMPMYSIPGLVDHH